MAVARDQIVQTAEKFVARGKIEPAIREYRKLLADNPNDINTLNRIGDLYARIQRVDEAIDFFTQIAERYTEEGFFVKAIAIYKKIIKLNPTLLEVYEALAELYAKQGLTNEARTQFQVLADYYQKHDNATSASAIYGRLVDLEPENPSHHVKLAEIYQQQKLYEKALGEYRTIAELMLSAGHVPEAAQVYERALAIDAQNIPFLTDAVLKLRQAGGQAAAARFLSLAIERNPDAERIARLIGGEGTLSGIHPLVPGAPPARPAAAPPATTATALPTPEPDVAARPFSVDLDLDEDEVMPGTVAGAPAAAWNRESEPLQAREPVRPESDEIELDLDEVFVLEMDEDEPASLVKPPPDMLAGAPRRPAWALDAEDSRPEENPENAEAPTPLAEALAALEEPAARPARPDDEASWSEIAEIDLGEMGRTGSFELVDPFRDMLEGGDQPAESPSARLDAEELERTAAGLHARLPERQEDLLTEAEVLARYGLEDKAIERLHDALRADPKHLEAYALLVQLHLDRGRMGPAAEVGQDMARAVGRRTSEVWDQVRRKLASVGIVIEEPQAKAPPQRAPSPEPLPRAEFGGMFEELLPPLAPVEQAPGSEIAAHFAPDEPPVVEPPPPPVAPAPVVKPRPSKVIDRELAALIGPEGKGRPGRRPAPAAKPSAVSPPPAAAPPPPAPLPAAAETAWIPPQEMPEPFAMPPPSNEMFDPRGIAASLEDLDDDDFVVPGLREIGPPLSASADALDDTGMSWLDEAEALRSAEPNGQGAPPLKRLERIFSEDDFFDLAGELEQELEREVGGGDLLAGPAEQTLEEIVEGFKKGVSENLSSTDYDTHFNLGIAYREMGLIDEAIGEFQLAAKDRSFLVSCCSNLGLCFLEKGIPELAVKWYRRGLDAPGVSEDDSLGLLYDLGNAYLSSGDGDTAYKTFVELYGINSNYRDVVARIEELGHPH
ncbi:MAG TPA: tetratricopeptide repeat protein [Thermoanaerobaculia bacterium]|jgi:tetratricopeptide (TPR) repeat protein|nr:tetratricopeptide repeat protein [Thermoanaerobaculia bacterium]